MASHPGVVVRARTIEEVVAVMRNQARHPAPVRVVGANFSITACAVADGGTLSDMSAMRRIVEVVPQPQTAMGG